MKHHSPLRYPGGKASLAGLLSNIISLNDLHGCTYYEPFAGGAGAALGLLQQEIVSELYLNDADLRIYAFWRTALHSSERFAERISTVPLTIEEWHKQHSICAHPKSHSQFDIGFATFFMNRCNRSGVLMGSGPIGGYRQSGLWRIDARFNRETLTNRILALGRIRKQIHIFCKDAIDFLKFDLPIGRDRTRVFVYLDPPYVSKGKRLYLNFYEQRNHSELARYINKQATLKWIMSYDDSNLIRKLYAKQKISNMPIRYTLQEKRSAHELIIAPNQIITPNNLASYNLAS